MAAGIEEISQAAEEASMSVEQSELDDAYAEIRAYGFREVDFTFTHVPYKH